MSLAVRRMSLLLIVIAFQSEAKAKAPSVIVIKKSDRFVFLRDAKPLLTYVFKDKKVGRPYFFDLFTSSGIKVSRNHPPQAGDDQDHPHHTGVFFTFGDLNKIDFWHLRGKVKFLGFAKKLKLGKNDIRFSVQCSYHSADGKRDFLHELTHHRIRILPHGFLIEYDVNLSVGKDGATIGSKEEGGLAARVATPLAASSKKGGYLIDNSGRKGGKLVWGKQADWVDYRGTVKDKSVGLMIMTHPKNANRCWWHARDYGLLAANPFGPLNARGKQTVVKRGKPLRLRYGVLVHESSGSKFDAKRAYADTYVKGK